jgi:hypothetical protein
MCLVGLLLLFASSSNAEMRKWTRKNGKEFEAEFVNREGPVVTLKKSDGSKMTIKMPGLSEEDRKYVRQQGKSQNTEKPEGQVVASSGISAQPQADERKVEAAGKDSGMAVVQKATNSPGVKFELGMTANEQLNHYMEANGWNEGWVANGSAVLQKGQHTFNTNDPAKDRDFFVNRDVAARLAVLDAKGRIIEFVASKMSGWELSHIPGTPSFDKLAVQIQKEEDAVAAEKPAVAQLLRNLDADQADALERATGKDLVVAMDKAIKRLDKEASAQNGEKVGKLENVKARYLEATANLARLEQEADSLKQTSLQAGIGAERHAKMVLVGATVIQQAESWNPDLHQYDVAVLVCWSVALQKSAYATMTATALTVPSQIEGKKTVHEWLNEQDLGAMTGPRQYLDPSGQRYFLGICARPVSENAAIDRKAHVIADLYAAQTAVFCLYADVESYTWAQTKTTEKNIGATAKQSSDEDVEEQISQHFKDMTIRGLAQMVDKVAVHPITNQKIHVCVYGISPESAQAALKVQWENVLAARGIAKDQQRTVEEKIAPVPAPKPHHPKRPPQEKPVQQTPGSKAGSAISGQADHEFK